MGNTNETVVTGKLCEIERNAYLQALIDLHSAKEAYNTLMEEYTSQLASLYVDQIGMIGSTIGSFPFLNSTPARGAVTKSSTKIISPYIDDIIAKISIVTANFEVAKANLDMASKELTHCLKDDFYIEMGEATVTDELPDGDLDFVEMGEPVVTDEMPDGDADFSDYMPDGDVDLDNYNEADSNDSVKQKLECQVCGYEGEISDFGDEDNPICPYCGSKVDK